MVQAEPDALIGRQVELDGVQIVGLAGRGFWIAGAGGGRAFVLPGDGELATFASGQRVSIDGSVFHLPEQMRSRLDASGGAPGVYIYAWNVTPVETGSAGSRQP